MQAAVEINVVEAREMGPPEGAEGLHWILLTALPCRRLAGTGPNGWLGALSA
jgi:hypothetical protein